MISKNNMYDEFDPQNPHGKPRDDDRAVRSKDEPFPHMHYSDPYWNKEKTIFGKTRKGLFYNYDDRLVQWDRKKHDEAVKAAEASGAKHSTVTWWEEYLTNYHGWAVTVEHVQAGTNRSSGFAYYIFGYNGTAPKA